MDDLIVSTNLLYIHNYTACQVLHCKINVKIDNNVTSALLVHCLVLVSEITM